MFLSLFLKEKKNDIFSAGIKKKWAEIKKKWAGIKHFGLELIFFY